MPNDSERVDYVKARISKWQGQTIASDRSGHGGFGGKLLHHFQRWLQWKDAKAFSGNDLRNSPRAAAHFKQACTSWVQKL